MSTIRSTTSKPWVSRTCESRRKQEAAALNGNPSPPKDSGSSVDQIRVAIKQSRMAGTNGHNPKKSAVQLKMDQAHVDEQTNAYKRSKLSANYIRLQEKIFRDQNACDHLAELILKLESKEFLTEKQQQKLNGFKSTRSHLLNVKSRSEQTILSISQKMVDPHGIFALQPGMD